MEIIDKNNGKALLSENYNYIFRKSDGLFMRWGKTTEDDPQYSPFGPEIADIEITTSCNGINDRLCSFCYKSNTPNGKNMSFKKFKTIFKKLPNTITQIAFGADSHATSNPDLFKMMWFSRQNKVIPNITIADITEETANKLVEVCGAVAVSRYIDKNICYNSVEKLTNKGLTQTNIHIVSSEKTYKQIMETMRDRLTDKRLIYLNAIVLLSLKKKGRGVTHEPLSKIKFEKLVNFALKNNIKIGFDSCGCNRFLESIKTHKDYKQFETYSEPCESTCFSIYLNVEGKVFPCSFCEKEKGWEKGIDIINCQNFVKDIWENQKIIKFREILLKNQRNCPIFKI